MHDKRLLQIFGELAALERRATTDPDVAELIADRVAEVASINGGRVIDAFLRWRASGSPIRDPRPAPVYDTGAEVPRAARRLTF
jgi:hypothetical protein